MRVAHINFTSEHAAGRGILSVCESLQDAGHAALFCHAEGGIPETVPSYRIGGRIDRVVHRTLAMGLDCSGFLSQYATKKLTHQLRLYKPDIVHLHTLHGYYLNLPILMDYLRDAGMPVVWTLADCWAYTGHCAQYAMAGCKRYASGCHHCPNLRRYPKSYGLDRSKKNWQDKRDAILQLQALVPVAPSEWMESELQKSFLSAYALRMLRGGIDLQRFRPVGTARVESVIRRYGLHRHGEKPILLSAANPWSVSKGINDLMDLQDALKEEAVIVVVGLTKKQISYLPPEMIGVPVIYGIDTLRALYTAADIYLSLRYEDSVGMTSMEALACGTQVLCYDRAALPEIITGDTGMSVPAGSIQVAADACRALLENPKSPDDCVNRALEFDHDALTAEYMQLYDELLGILPPANGK